MKSSGVSVQCGEAEPAGNQDTHLKVPQQNATCSQSLWAIVEGGQWGLEWPKETMGFRVWEEKWGKHPPGFLY